MKKRFLKVVFMAMAVVLIVALTACSAEVVYYLDTTGAADPSNPAGSIGQPIDSGNTGNTGNNGSSGTGNNSGNTSSGTNTGDNGNASGGGNSTVVEDPNFKGDGSTYKLTVWCALEDVEMISGMLDDYKDKYSANTYEFKLQKVGENNSASTVLEDVNGAADVFSFANDKLGELCSNNALVAVPAAYTAQIEAQIDVAKLACTDKSTYYAFPYNYENCLLYYNTSLITDVSSMENILSASIAGVDYNLGIDMGDSYYTTMFLYTAGVQLFGEKGNDPTSVDLDNAAAKRACEYIQWLGKQDKLGLKTKEDQYAALKTGKVAAMISGPHMMSQFKDALGSSFGVAMLPTIRIGTENKDGNVTVGDTQLISFSGVKMYGVSRKATEVRDEKTTAEAIKLAAFLANSDNQQIRFEERDFCPTDSVLFDMAYGQGKTTVDVVIDQSEYAKLKPGIKEMGSYWTSMATFLLGVYRQTQEEKDWSAQLKSIENKLLGK